MLGFEYGYSLAEPERADAVGGAVRRLRQRRAGGLRPVHLLGRAQVAAHVRPRLPAAARLRGPGAGALLGAARALPADVRRGQHAGRQLHDAGELLPHPAPAAEARLPQAADPDDAEVAAAPQARGVAARRDGAGHVVPPPAVGRCAAAAGREDQARRRRQDPPRRAVLAARSITTSTRSARSAASTTSICCASSSSIRSRSRRWCSELGALHATREVVWCQEEPRNMGAWTFVEPYLEWVLDQLGAKSKRPRYAGRAGLGGDRDRPDVAAPRRSSRRSSTRRWRRRCHAGGTGIRVAAPSAIAARRTRRRGCDVMTEIRVPTLGESVTEATIGKWFKKPGDAVAVDEPLVELETDKVTIEVPAPAAGVLAEIAAKDGETVAVGALLGPIKEGAGAAPAAQAAPTAGRRSRDAAPSRAARRPPQPRRSRRAADAPLAPVGAQARRRDRHRRRDRARHRQGRPRHQGRHAGGDRARRGGADAGRAAGRRRAGARAVAAPTMPRARSACG